MKNKVLSIILAIAMMFTTICYANSENLDQIAQIVYDSTPNPSVSSIGGEWAVIGLARADFKVADDYFETYYNNLEQYLLQNDGVLHDKKYTEYSRVVLALTSIGADPTDVAGYNLLTPLGDFDSTVWQGINGAIWALIALDSGEYQVPQNDKAETQATRQMYVDYILSLQLDDGGFALSGSVSDPDITGMALQALSNYSDDTAVSQAIETALYCMSNMQDENGGFESFDSSNSEAVVQMIVAITSLDIDITDERFVKNGNTLVDALIDFQIDDGFTHSLGDTSVNQMATEQGFYALVAVNRQQNGQNKLYDMTDVSITTQSTESETTRHPDISEVSVKNPNITFSDINESANQDAILELASREIINGKGNDIFEPNSSMTRAEFATIIVKALGLTPNSSDKFQDVAQNDWFVGYVGTAESMGIVTGISDTTFNPNGIITREQAAVMVALSAKLCGMDTELSTFASRDILAVFMDYVSVSDWALDSVAFCYNNEIFDVNDQLINPSVAVTREEVAQMVYNLLDSATLLN